LKYNSKYVQLNHFIPCSIEEKQSAGVKVSALRNLSGHLSKEWSIKGDLASYYQLIPNLKEIVSILLKDCQCRCPNRFYLIFDDLDIGVTIDNKNSLDALTELIRITKAYNLDVFRRNEIPGGIILLLRDDISEKIKQTQPDTAKIFTSYSIPLIWYNHRDYEQNENSILLKKFINRRIKINFDKANIPVDDDPWYTLIEAEYDGKSSFKHVLNHTFYKPRDLILLFQCLPQKKYSIPIGSEDLNDLLKTYAEEFVSELKNELTFHYNTSQIEALFQVLKEMSRHSQIYHSIFVDALKRRNFKEEDLNILYNYSIIGNEDCGKLMFKCRNTSHIYNPAQNILLPYILKVYFSH